MVKIPSPPPPRATHDSSDKLTNSRGKRAINGPCCPSVRPAGGSGGGAGCPRLMVVEDDGGDMVIMFSDCPFLTHAQTSNLVR